MSANWCNFEPHTGAHLDPMLHWCSCFFDIPRIWSTNFSPLSQADKQSRLALVENLVVESLLDSFRDSGSFCTSMCLGCHLCAHLRWQSGIGIWYRILVFFIEHDSQSRSKWHSKFGLGSGLPDSKISYTLNHKIFLIVLQFFIPFWGSTAVSVQFITIWLLP